MTDCVRPGYASRGFFGKLCTLTARERLQYSAGGQDGGVGRTFDLSPERHMRVSRAR